VFSSFLSSGSPRQGTLLACLVDRHGMCCVVFALGAVGVDLFRILHFVRPRGKAGLGARASFYPLSWGAWSYLDRGPLPDEAFSVFIGKNCDVFFEEWSVSLEVDANDGGHVFDEAK